MPEADDQNFYAFRSEDDFNRAARATRFAEEVMRGPLESKEFTRRLKSSTEVTVEVNADADEDGYYGGKFVYYDDVETLSWEAIDDDDTCLVFGLNNEELTFTPATKYFGRVVGRTEDATPIVAVTVGGGGAVSSKIPAEITAYAAPWYSFKEIALSSVGPGWVDKVGGATGQAYRMPIVNPATPPGEPTIGLPPLLEVGDTVLVWPSEVYPGKYEMTPWGEKRQIGYITQVVTTSDFNADTCVYTKVMKKIRIVGQGIQIDEITL